MLNGPSASRTRRGLLIHLLAILLAVPAPPPAHGVVLPSGRPADRWRIATPDAPVSAAWRLGSGLADKSGRLPPDEPGYVLHARVLVRSSPNRPDPGPAVAAHTDHPLRPHAGVTGWWVIECGTVREAVLLAHALAADPRVSAAEIDLERPRHTRGLPTDPSFPSQWFLRNVNLPLADLNAEAAWGMGYTGAGVTVGIVEGGWQTNHPDIAPNYNAAASMPGGSATSHSTSCAGLIAAVADNGAGGVGVAYGARVSKLIYGSPSATADAFAFKPELNAIKSNSWGPPDLGELAAISQIELDALAQAATTGRGGLGTVFVWAAGNGGLADRVDYDPYASSRHTIAIGAVGDLDRRASYNEPGASLFAVTHSSGNTRFVFTTANQSGYNPDFGGTSAACPIAAGTVALLLDANPSLSARDVQHILARTARVCDPTHADWTINGGGHPINHHYGFGALDAGAAAALAAAWDPVPAVDAADTGVVAVNAPIPDNTPAGVTRILAINDNLNAEHVELVLDASTTFVGDLRITLTSPSGTVSVFAEPRDDPQDDLNNRLFTTARFWDEPARGDWRVTISDRGPFDLATWHTARLIVHGTPAGPSPCSPADLSEPFGVLNFFDLSRFIALYNARDDAADLTGDGTWTFFDIVAYIASYNAGCP